MTLPPALRLLTASFADRPALEIAVSRAVLERVAAGALPETFRLARTAPTLSFGRLDALAPGFPAAVVAARRLGFAPVHRLGGGRAAVFHEGTIAFGHAVADEQPTAGTHVRFRALTAFLVEVLRDLGLDARAGELPGEYCPGTYSVNLGGRVKVAGIAQRVLRRGAYTEGVLVVDGGERVREVLIPVYAALGLAWEPATAGALTDVAPGLTVAAVLGALRRRLEADHAVVEAPLDPVTRALAARYEAVQDATDQPPPAALEATPKVA